MLRRFFARLTWLIFWGGLLVVLYHYTPLRQMPVLFRLWTQALEGPLRVPVRGVPSTALSDTWGATRSSGRTHEGIDIFAPCGQPVVSATEGIVLHIGENTLGGRTVRVLGPSGSIHYYAHLERYGPVSAGDHVKPGDVLGHVGNSGNARGTPCHLHYGIYLDGSARNPYPYLLP